MRFIRSGLIRSFRASLVVLSLSTTVARADLYKDAGGAIVRIAVEGSLRTPDAEQNIDYLDIGTGFVVSPDGLVLTAGHLFPDASLFEDGKYWIRVQRPTYQYGRMSTSAETLTATLLKSGHYPGDIAILKLVGVQDPLAYLRLCDDYNSDTKVTMLGYSGGENYLQKSVGSVRAPDDGVNPVDLQLPSTKGDSGAPIFNEMGSVFAVSIGQHTVDGEDVNMSDLAVAIPITINHLAPEAHALKGVSYFPKCDETVPVATGTVELKIGAAVKGNETRLLRFEPPPGKLFTGNFSELSVNGSPIVSKTNLQNFDVRPKELTVELHSENINVAGLDVAGFVVGSILAETRPDLPTPLTISESPSAQVQNFLVSTRRISDNSSIYEATLKAPNGYVFADLLKNDWISAAISGKFEPIAESSRVTVFQESSFISEDRSAVVVKGWISTAYGSPPDECIARTSLQLEPAK